MKTPIDPGAEGINWATTVRPVKKMIFGIVKTLLKMLKLENIKKSAAHKTNHKKKVIRNVLMIWNLSYKAKVAPSLNCLIKLKYMI